VTAVSEFLDEEIAAGSFPGAVALVGSAEGVLETAFAGHAAVEPQTREVAAETQFDLASLTKPLCVGGIFGAQAHLLPLAAAPGRFLPEWKKTRFEGITLEHLLTHASGLPAWYPFYARGEGAVAYRRTLAQLEPEAPAGSRVIYSDPNFLLLTQVLEECFASRLDRLFDELVAAPAGSAARFLPPPQAPTAATEKGDRFERVMTESRGLAYAHFRDGVVWGEVHDGNAFHRGGVSGNAGLFGTAHDVWDLARRWLEPRWLALSSDRTPELGEARGLAWQGKRGAGSAVPGMSPRAFGHTGFTGTSLWIDPDSELIAILLTNRIHPEVREIPFNQVRQRFHTVVWERFGVR
jgi:CubicO group peptidase (beta-lactamase class C family)